MIRLSLCHLQYSCKCRFDKDASGTDDKYYNIDCGDNDNCSNIEENNIKSIYFINEENKCR